MFVCYNIQQEIIILKHLLSIITDIKKLLAGVVFVPLTFHTIVPLANRYAMPAILFDIYI